MDNISHAFSPHNTHTHTLVKHFKMAVQHDLQLPISRTHAQQTNDVTHLHYHQALFLHCAIRATPLTSLLVPAATAPYAAQLQQIQGQISARPAPSASVRASSVAVVVVAAASAG